MADEVGDQCRRARAVLVVDEDAGGAQIEEREGDRAAGPAGADQGRVLVGDRGTPERVLEAAPEPDAIGIVAHRASVRARS